MASKANRKSTSARKSKKRTTPILWGLAVALLVAGGAYYLLDTTDVSAKGALTYTAADIAHNKPFRAIHEMRAGPPIPFLPSGQPQPKIVVPKNYFDFGRVGAREVVKTKFLVRNEGEAPLTISRAYTSCSCTTANFTARIIPPGKATLVTLVFDAGFHDARGQTVKRGIIIENNDRDQPKVEIWTRAAVGWK
ncbi:MAG: DUF1573 domain-containing protein [Kiloniellaceae bacterium]